MDRTSKLLIGSGALLALLLGFVAYTALAAEPTMVPTASVVVVRDEIPPYTQFTASNVDLLLTTRRVLVGNAPSDAFTQPMQVVGRVTTIRLMPGELLRDAPDRLTTRDGDDGRASVGIPRDKVALTIPATEALTVAGALRPGDRVDIIVTWTPPGEPAITRNLYQSVPVFAVGAWQDPTDKGRGPLGRGAPPRPAASSITLLLELQQALGLQYVQQTGGDVALALRRLDQGEDLAAAPITAARMRQDLLGAPAPATNP